MEEIQDLAVMRPDQVNVPEEIQEAIRSLIRWAGDDPDREGLIDTPKRVAKAWKYYCRGYREDPENHLKTVFEEVGGYDDIVLLKDIPFYSHCEHHMAPIMGHAHIAYLPDKKVVGLSKLARVLKGYAHRLQIQERLTAQVADCIWNNLRPRGVAVVISAVHSCMAARGVETPNVQTVTKTLRGIYSEDSEQAKMILNLMGV
ncbi:GTP cyclohydrolase I [Zymomonas mobilis]|uniref:GTP cyclohydrolase I FolE n=1 Tax=Zymomonas mobilis TaxID=542 RepID=UPI00026D8405|nr:GTP cyclohydrolase I FolE [Zymomonas mobilis]AFN56011.1 GTP cyclohydrolase 1 [Zymomonas mobilis subsp. mobilis ATCC 29191]TQK78558.1 GTP cyclohydrolase I [Zymomonas mobilis]TQL16237.1 GTP cyclohydrolase I [Zymomonas mobilis]GEB87449.1 GTP cyclohydrolase 1 [Zymomonas mobilis subsp. mobilis]